MSEIAIRAEGLGKLYRLGEVQREDKLRNVLGEYARAPWKVFRRPKKETFWALKSVDLEVKHGEVLGLIGRNGAGKTTLLKILSRITRPTTGWAEIYGRVGSLLEVGTGFHPELSGRDNVYLSGAILGMSKAEIRKKFEEIVAFAEIERFLDTQVKHYSSGMYVRLAFAVAAHLDPEILFVDEVLAVGDASFQKKCLGKMGDVAREGRTVVLVSHNMTAIQSLCDRVVWLEKGSVLRDGPVKPVMSAYLAESIKHVGASFWPDVRTAPGNDIVRIRRAEARVSVPVGQEAIPNPITVHTPVMLNFDYWVLEEGHQLSLSLHLFTADGSRAFNTFPLSAPLWKGRPFPVGLFRSTCRIPPNLLNDGLYRVQLLVVEDQSEELVNIEEAFTFEVSDERQGDVMWHGKILGVVRPNLAWNTEIVDAEAEDELESAPLAQAPVDGRIPV